MVMDGAWVATAGGTVICRHTTLTNSTPTTARKRPPSASKIPSLRLIGSRYLSGAGVLDGSLGQIDRVSAHVNPTAVRLASDAGDEALDEVTFNRFSVIGHARNARGNRSQMDRAVRLSRSMHTGDVEDRKTSNMEVIPSAITRHVCIALVPEVAIASRSASPGRTSSRFARLIINRDDDIVPLAQLGFLEDRASNAGLAFAPGVDGHF